VDCFESGLISCGFVRGMYRSVIQISRQMTPMKMMGSHVSIQPEMLSYQWCFASGACGAALSGALRTFLTIFP
jgi:hypothetical protein